MKNVELRASLNDIFPLDRASIMVGTSLVNAVRQCSFQLNATADGLFCTISHHPIECFGCCTRVFSWQELETQAC